MMEIRILIILINMCLIPYNSWAQEREPNFVIITYEVDRNDDGHPPIEYHWITSMESLDKGDAGILKFPVYFSGFSKQDITDCENGNNLYIFGANSVENFDLGDKLKNQIKNLQEIIKTNKMRVLRVNKKWKGGPKEKVMVYLTPIFGEFCSSNLSKDDGKKIGYQGKVYIPPPLALVSDGCRTE